MIVECLFIINLAILASLISSYIYISHLKHELELRYRLIYTAEKSFTKMLSDFIELTRGDPHVHPHNPPRERK